MKPIVTFLFIVLTGVLNAQILTITNTGETGTSGNNWSISGNTLTVTGTANIQASVIENHLSSMGPLVVDVDAVTSVIVDQAINVTTGANALSLGTDGNNAAFAANQSITVHGSLSVYAGQIYLYANLTTGSNGANILLKTFEYPPGANITDGFISLLANVDLTTNNGDIILWTNATNRTSGQVNNEIGLGGNNTLNSSGGKIVLAGGLDDGSNGGTASDGIPDGYAYRGGYAGAALDIRAAVTLNSGGGDVIVRGEQNGSDVAVGLTAAFAISNAGEVIIEGKNTTAGSILMGTTAITTTVANAGVFLLGSTDINNSNLGLTSITTQGGDVVIATNIDDATDGESAKNGQLRLTSGLSVTTNGGDITLGGGNSNGTNYAMGSTSTNVNEGIRIDDSLSLNSDGGDIALRGKTPAVGVGNEIGGAGINFINIASGSINSGSGTVLLDGYSQTSVGNAIAGLLWWNLGSAGTFTIESANTAANAITLNGFSAGTSGQAYGIETEGFNTLNLLATASGGGIIVNTGNSIANYYDVVFRGPLNIQAVDGPIALKGGQLGGVANGYLYFANNVYLGSKASTAITSSSSDILIQFDRFDFPAGSRFIATDGAVTLQPNGASFGMAVNTNFFNWNQNSQTMSGLTIGKLGNTADISQGVEDLTANGPISVYGGNININESLESTASGENILFKGTGFINHASSKTMTTNGGDVTYWADSDGNGSGYVQTGSSTAITSAGGAITLGGGTNIATGYARGADLQDAQTEPTFDLRISGVHLKNGTNLNSAGGNITLRGQNLGTASNTLQFGIMGHNATLDAGSGKIAMYGLAGGSANQNAQAISNYGNGWTIRSSNASSDAIVLFGDGSSYNGTVATLGINFSGIIESTGGGGIQLTGKSGTSAGFDRSMDIYGSILANTGTITLTAENNNATQTGLFLSGATLGSETGTNVTASTSNIILKSDNTVFNTTASDIKTSGEVSILPLNASTSFGVAQSFGSNLNLSTSVSGLTIGKATNTADIMLAGATSIAGPITIYGGNINLNEDLSSSAGSTISLYGNTLNFGSGRTVSSSGQLVVATQDPSLAIGMAGASGSLSLPVSYFITNFSDGFANIQIGSGTQTGAISTNAFNLQDNMTLLTSGALTLGGIPELGSNDMTLGEDITTINLGSNFYFKSDSTGRLKRQISDGNSRLLPVGRASYNPVTITNNTGSADVLSVRVLDEVFLNGSSGQLVETPHVKVTWDLDKDNANGGSGIDAEFGWSDSQEYGAMGSYRLNHHNGANWELASGSSGSVSGSTFKTMTHTNYLGTFSPFAINQDGSPLPVEFLGMHYDCVDGGGVELTWLTASELNAQHFEVMHSADGFTWKKVGTVTASGTTNTLSEYQFIDAQPSRSSLRYYKLKQVDFNGDYEWLPIISVNCEAVEGVRLYPNPAQDKAYIAIPSNTVEAITIQLIDQTGRVVNTANHNIKKGVNNIALELTGLQNGMYTVLYANKNMQEALKLIINK